MLAKTVSKHIWIVFGLALLLRLLLFAAVASVPERAFTPDSKGYHRLALNLLAGRGFSLSSQAPYAPDSLRTPTYPAFLALIYAVAGPHPVAAIAVQVVLSALTCVLTYRLGEQLWGNHERWIAGLLLAVSLGSIVYANYLLTETLFTFLLVAACERLVAYWRGRSERDLALVGLALGLAILCRPIAAYLPLVMIVLMVAMHWPSIRQALRSALILALVTVLLVGPWVVRNWMACGVPTLSSIANYNLLFYNAVSLEADLRGIGQEATRQEMQRDVEAMLADLGLANASDAQKAQVYGRLAWDIIKRHPLRYALLHLRCDLNMFLPNVTEFLEQLGLTRGGRGTLSVLNEQGLWAAIRHYFGDQVYLLFATLPFMAILGLTYGGGLVGTAVLLCQRAWFPLALLLSVIAYFALLPGAPAHPRFRVPIMPHICLLAAVGLTSVWRGWCKRRRRCTRS